jgi:hypothetical protein
MGESFSRSERLRSNVPVTFLKRSSDDAVMLPLPSVVSVPAP